MLRVSRVVGAGSWAPRLHFWGSFHRAVLTQLQSLRCHGRLTAFSWITCWLNSQQQLLLSQVIWLPYQSHLFLWSSHAPQPVKNLVLSLEWLRSLPWHRFEPWLRNFHQKKSHLFLNLVTVEDCWQSSNITFRAHVSYCPNLSES